MERLFERIQAEGMARYLIGSEKYVPIPHRDGVVTKAAADEMGLTLVLHGESKPFIVRDAQIRVDVGEKVVVYPNALCGQLRDDVFTAMPIDGLQVLDENSKVKFQYVAKNTGNQRVFLEESDPRLAQ